MNPTTPKNTNPIPRRHAFAGFVAGAAWLVTGALQLTGDETFATTAIETDAEHAMLAAFAVAVLFGPLAILGLARRAGALRPALAVVTGGVLLTIASTTTNILGDDPSWFAALAVLANLMWLAGTIIVARRVKQSNTAPAWVAYALPVIQICALPLSRVGGGVLAAGILFAISYLMLAAGSPQVTARAATA